MELLGLKKGLITSICMIALESALAALESSSRTCISPQCGMMLPFHFLNKTDFVCVKVNVRLKIYAISNVYCSFEGEVSEMDVRLQLSQLNVDAGFSLERF